MRCSSQGVDENGLVVVPGEEVSDSRLVFVFYKTPPDSQTQNTDMSVVYREAHLFVASGL